MTNSDIAQARCIRDVGLRATPSRIAVLRVLEGSKYPIDATNLCKAVRLFDQVTVYRILEAFVDAGLARRVNFDTGRALYERSGSTEHHHHLVCKGCGRVEDIAWCPVKHGSLRLQSSNFAHVDAHALEFFGECKACAHS